jgi:hypothetical protein
MNPARRSQVFACPRCKSRYWGGPNETLPNCPHCGYDHRPPQRFRFDLLFLMVLIIAMLGFLLLTSSYTGGPAGSSGRVFPQSAPEKLPGR